MKFSFFCPPPWSVLVAGLSVKQVINLVWPYHYALLVIYRIIEGVQDILEYLEWGG